MPEMTSELMYEVPKTIQADLALMKEDMSDIKSRLTSLDSRLAIVHTDLAAQTERSDRLDLRIERIEKRRLLTAA